MRENRKMLTIGLNAIGRFHFLRLYNTQLRTSRIWCWSRVLPARLIHLVLGRE
jgi:hypothetical protein